MIQILAVVCTLTAPLQCKDLRLSFMAESVTPQQCFLYGQMELAKWSQVHPNWRVHKFSCSRSGTFAKA